jgi:hypothetical protein
MHFQAYFKHTITDQGFQNTTANGRATGYQFEIRFPGYRGSHLSCITKLDLKLDGVAVDPADVLFCLNGKEFLLAQLPELFVEYWFILDNATLKVAKAGGLAPGAHEVEVDFGYRVPYTGYYGNYIVAEGSHRRTLALGR